jgi:5-methylcytosine-specific restriction endonuclease McrA
VNGDSPDCSPLSKSARAAQERARWRAALRGGDGAFEDEPAECFGCGSVFARKALRAIDEIPGYRWARYCPACVEEIRRAHARRCLLCDAAYTAGMPGEGVDGLCPACCSPERQRELGRVRNHLARARVPGLPADLTLADWLATLDHFGRSCAYCRVRPYTDLDHFIPLSAGGGTTAANCVPACARCNNLKRALDPGHPLLGPGLPEQALGAALERVRRYLAILG